MRGNSSWNRDFGSMRPRTTAGARGQRMPVTARDRSHAVAIARTRPWWGRVESQVPFASLGRWWFVVRAG